MSKSVFYSILLFVLIVLLSSCSKLDKGNKNFPSLGVEMVAHKGVHFDSIAPPNSLDAILLAHRAGFKTIEIDLNRTADNEIILLHDNHLNQTLYLKDGYKEIDSLTFCFSWTLEEMRDKFVFISPNSAMRRPIATLEESLLLCKKLNIYPYLEFKEYGFRDRLHLIDKTIKTAQRILGRDNFAVTSWYLPMAEYVRKQYPYLVVSCDPIHDRTILNKNSFSYFPNWEKIDPELVNEQHQKGYTVSTWTVDKTMLDSVCQYNVDKILTDNIAPSFDRAKAVLNKHSDIMFSDFTSNGAIENNILTLMKGETIELRGIDVSFVPFGAIHLSTDIRGKFAIEATDFYVERENYSDDFQLISFQYMIFNKEPQFKIVALEDNTTVKSIWFAVSEY